MKSILTLMIALVISVSSLASSVTIIITEIPDNTPPDDEIYIAGNFNGWNPGDPAYMLVENLNGWPEIVVEGDGTLEFKFTRGSWETVEGGENGGYLPNRTFTMGTADTLELTILSWEDLGGSNHTAAENVIVMDEDFYMPQFNRYRRIWLYLPPNYDSVEDHFPVLYMHDGQNLFDAATSFAGEWEVDETLNELYSQGKSVPIVVGIDNGGADRIDEYTPWPHPQYGGGDGDIYTQFIVETLKPYIDENYRTLADRENTGVMGSSLGGLISHYIALKHQDIFSKSGIFSPSFWFNDSCYDFAYSTGKQHTMRLYMMGGTNESTTLVQEMEMMEDTLFAAGFSENEFTTKVVAGGEHNEQLWREEFGEAYEWLFLENPSSIFTNSFEAPIFLFYQNGRLSCKATNPLSSPKAFYVELFSITGQVLLQTEIKPDDTIALPDGLKGICIARISGEKNTFVQKILIPGE